MFQWNKNITSSKEQSFALQCFTPAIKQKHQAIFDRLKLKSFTVDSRKTFVLSKPHQRKLISKPQLDLNSLIIKGKGRLGGPIQQRCKIYSDYSQFNTFWKTVYSHRQNFRSDDVRSMMTIRSLSQQMELTMAKSVRIGGKNIK